MKLLQPTEILLIPKSLIIILLSMIFGGCTKKELDISGQDVVVSWSEMALYITQHTPSNSPTFASRGVGYIGLTMYESIVQGFPSHQSLAAQLNGLDQLPVPAVGVNYDWILSYNAGQASILKNIYNQTSDRNKLEIDSLEQVYNEHFGSKVDREVKERSVNYGKSVAEAIFEWSKIDGGHRGYLKNFDKDFIRPNGPGSWKPPLYAQSISHYPLHPHWGNNRTFLKQNTDLQIPEMIPYDTSQNSQYYKQFLSVYKKDLILTQEEKEAAIWWSDDPDVTFTPPGHSFYLANLAVKEKNPAFIQCAETYARVGLAVADAFINCWKWKYHFFSERPNTFIPQFIDDKWESFWPDPPFPSFPSGHAIQAAAFATSIADIYGDSFSFTDSSHVGRKRDELREVDFKARSFDSFWEMAQETADSRFYGGIHTVQDNEAGLVEGARIARNVNNLAWRSEKLK